MPELLRQVRIIHLSDLHFGKQHRSRHDHADASTAGIPPLDELLKRDWCSDEWNAREWKENSIEPNPLLVCVTGDLTQDAAADEYNEARAFLDKLRSANGPLSQLDPEFDFTRLGIVPGNHDVTWDEPDDSRRWQPYCAFFSSLFSGVRSDHYVDSANAGSLSRVVDLTRIGVVLVELNSCLWVRKDSADEKRGQIGLDAIHAVKTQLKTLETHLNTKKPRDSLDNYIKIALVHHHPILIPPLVEPDRGYDAIMNSGSLLNLLRDFGFHLALHGHKHLPQVFSYDSECAWESRSKTALLVGAGGSASSKSLPEGETACNTYNMISLKWHPAAQQLRIRFVTRGLVVSEDGEKLLPKEWYWKTLRVIDRRLMPYATLPSPKNPKTLNFGGNHDAEAEIRRRSIYANLKGNMPVVEVMPSLIPGQAYEARLWIVAHNQSTLPKTVTWSAGPMFPQVVCDRDDDPAFCASLSYWGPMLVQAQLKFDDGSCSETSVYARVPNPGPKQEAH